MKKQKAGLRIGRYRLTPLGMCVAGAILLLILALIGILVAKGIGGRNDAVKPGEKSGKVTVTTPAPTVTVSSAPTATLTPSPSPTPAPTLRTARIRSLGEIVADHNILKAAYQQTPAQEGAEGAAEAGTFDFGSMFDMASGVMADADYTVAQVNGTMGGKGNDGYRGKKGEYNTPPHMMLALMENGVDMLALANDHALDELYDGLNGTISNCTKAGMAYIGAAASQEEHDTPKIVEINGIKVCFLNYTDSFTDKKMKNAAKEALEFGVNYAKNADCAADVAKAREAGADVVVAYMSWGKEGAEKASSEQGKLAKVLVQAGVDVIVGYNPRVVQAQPMFWLENENEDGTKQRTLCVCSVGTFLSDSEEKNQDCGIIFEFTIAETEAGDFEIINPTYIPTYVWRTDKGDGLYDYKVLACGEWLTAAPEGMSEKDYERLKTVWSGMQTLLGSTELSVSAN